MWHKINYPVKIKKINISILFYSFNNHFALI